MISSGTNRGGFTLDIKQDGEKISGIAKNTRGLRPWVCTSIILQEREGRPLVATYSEASNRAVYSGLGMVQAICTLEADGTLLGTMVEELGTEAAPFTAKRFVIHEAQIDLTPKSNSVFWFTADDEGFEAAVARFLEQLGISPVIFCRNRSIGGMDYYKSLRGSHPSGFRRHLNDA